MPKGKKHTPEQIVAILRRFDGGETAQAVCRELNISEATLYRWKQQYGAIELDEVKELKALRDENARLKRLVADQLLNIQVLKEVNAKKMVSPSQKRHAAQGVVAASMCSRRQVCRYLGLALVLVVSSATTDVAATADRSGHPRVVAQASALRLSPGACAGRTARLGVCPAHRAAGAPREGFRVIGPARRPKCPPRPDAKLKAEGLNDVWCIDLVFDVTQRGTTVKFLTIIDEGSHYCIDIVAGRRLGAAEVVQALAAAIAVHGAPRHLRCDNGGEFITRKLQQWLKSAGIATRFIEPALGRTA